MKRFFSLFCAVLYVPCALLLADDIAPKIRWYVDTERPAKADMSFRRGETVVMEPIFRNYGNPIDLTAAHLVIFRYRPSILITGNYMVITGSVANATSGIVNVRWTTAHESTNSTYSYEIAVQATDAMLLRSWGTMYLAPGIGDTGTTGAAPVAINSIDWARVDHSNIGAAPFLSTFNTDDIWAYLATLTNGTAALDVYSINARTPYQGSASDLTNFPAYLARTNDLTPNSITNVSKGVEEAGGRIEQVGEHAVVVHFPIVASGETLSTNRLYWAVEGQVIGYVDTNGITMLKGSIQLYDDDLNCNVRAYDGSKQEPSVSFYSSRALGWYRKSYNGDYAWAFAHNSNDVLYLDRSGLTMYSTNRISAYAMNVGGAYRWGDTNGMTTNLTVITSVLTNESGVVTGLVNQTLNFRGGILLP